MFLKPFLIFVFIFSSGFYFQLRFLFSAGFYFQLRFLFSAGFYFQQVLFSAGFIFSRFLFCFFGFISDLFRQISFKCGLYFIYLFSIEFIL